MRLAGWAVLGACLGCSSEDKLVDADGAGTGGSAGATMPMGARAGAMATGGGAGLTGSGGASTGGTGNAGLGSGGTGNTTSGSGGTTPSGVGVGVLSSCTDPNAVGPTLVRRISQLEYTNAARDLFGVTIDPSDLPSDEKLAGVFTANVTTPLTTDQFTRYDTKAKTVGDQVAPGIVATAGCDALCTQAYFVGKARQAFHGVLEPADQKTLEDLYAKVSVDDLTLAAATAVRFILDSPRFLYMVEFGTPEGSLARLSPGEVAGRLASFLWRSVPDAELLAAADAGNLATAEGIRAQATRMFDDTRSQVVLRQFAREWLGLTTTGGDATAQALDAETGNVFTTLAQGAGTYGDLFSSTRSEGPAELAAFYGVTTGADGSLTLPAERQGLLLRGGFQRSHIKGDLGSPTQRGKVVRQAMLCDPVAPPGNVNMNLPEPMDGQTAQDVFEQHASAAACKGCHALMDPIGAAFGTYGPDGKFDTALAKSTMGKIYPGTANTFEADFADTAGLMSVLGSSEVPAQCFTIQTARFALGRSEADGDACGLAGVWQGFQSGNLSLRTLFVELATSSLMQTRNIVKPGEACR